MQKSVNAIFYDIESLSNVFTLAAYCPRAYNTNKPLIYIYIIDDNNLINWEPMPEDPTIFKPSDRDANFISQKIISANPTTVPPDARIGYFRINDEASAKLLARTFGFSFSKINVSASSEQYTFHYDTDADYNEETDPFLMGYNSFNYDTVMLSLLFMEMFSSKTFNPNVTAQMMRQYNDELFSPMYKHNMLSYLSRKEGDPEGRDWSRTEYIIRQNMMRSGRHIDVARLNEKQVKVGLKRLLGLIGCQILESKNLESSQSHLESLDDLADLIAYNVSDVVNLETLFYDRSYIGQFETKRNMLKTYKELIYNYKNEGIDDDIIPFDASYDDYLQPSVTIDKPLEIDTSRVRYNRLYADSSSQQLSSRTLCPDTTQPLSDNKVISLDYPGMDDDVLDFAKKFYEERVLSHIPQTDPYYEEAKAQFDRVYELYDSLRGKNCNTSQRQYQLHPELKTPEAAKLHVNPRDFGAKCAVYIDGNGKPTSCYVSFSTGGIHGAEYNKALYDADMNKWETHEALLNDLRQHGFDTSSSDGAIQLRNSVTRLKDPIPIAFSDNQPHYCADFLKSGSTKTRAKWKPNPKPQLFKTSSSQKKTMTLNKRYVFTSAASVNHEDFKSYYPGLLRTMNVFNNPALGYDRYGEIFENKERYGIMMKDMSLSQEERDFARAQRENVKLILNSASGGGDASFDSPIRVNNKVTAMRIIGQLFTWYIGQAQALEGARIPSTNTDGLYTDLEETLNNEILERESKRIQVPIEPERMHLISKDSNNRIEYLVNDDGSIKVLSASGDLACWQGPSTSKSLDHPAIVDNVVVKYLTRIVTDGGQDALFEPFDRDLGMKLLIEASKEGDITHQLLMFQNILASSPSAFKYIFFKDANCENPSVKDNTARALQHYNRIFIMKQGYPGSVHLAIASGTIVTDAVKRTRSARQGNSSDAGAGYGFIFEHDKLATEILADANVCALPANIESKTIFAVPELESENREATIRKLPGIAPDTPVLVENHAILGMPEDISRQILLGLDLERYLDMVESTYEDNWRNVKP